MRGRVLRPSKTMSMIVCGDDFFIRPRCKNRKSSATPDKAGPMGAFVGCWGEGRVGGGGVLLGLTGRKERGWARRDGNGIFFNASCKPTRTSLKQKKPKVKITRCSSMSKFCPPAAASCKLTWGNNYERTGSHADGGVRGGGN